jgi:hypothetical protein
MISRWNKRAWACLLASLLKNRLKAGVFVIY